MIYSLSTLRYLRRTIGNFRPWQVAGLVLVLHASWAGAYLATGHDVRDFVRIGKAHVKQSAQSKEIRYDPSYAYPENRDPRRRDEGYDGQYYYFLALDPRKARFYMDVPSYRYLRPLYPAVARVISGQRASLVPWALLLINVFSSALATLALAAWLRARGQQPALALCFGFSAGLLLCLQRDLTEPLAYALVGAAILYFGKQPRRWLVAALLLCLAIFARQTAAAFVPVMVGCLLLPAAGPWAIQLRARMLKAGIFAAITLLPYLAYTAVIHSWLGSAQIGSQFTWIPFGGFVNREFELSRQGVSLVTVALPTLIFSGLAIHLIRRGQGRAAAACLLANALPLVVFNVDSNAYTARGRGALGVVLALVLCMPALLGLGRTTRRWVFAGVGLWLCMLPVMAIYGFSTGTV